MKKLSKVLGVVFLLFSINVVAQDGKGARENNPEERIEKKMEQMKIILDLSDKQYAAIEGVLKNSHDEMKALQGAAGKEHEAMKAKFQELKESTDKSISEVLSEDQLVKFQQMQSMKEERHGKRKHGGDHQKKKK